MARDAHLEIASRFIEKPANDAVRSELFRARDEDVRALAFCLINRDDARTRASGERDRVRLASQRHRRSVFERHRVRQAVETCAYPIDVPVQECSGFVEVASDTRLVWPDYQGNMMFMSLGNVAVHPFAGLLFVDFETGDVLQLTGRAAIDWDAAHAAAVPGAERLVTFDVDEVIAAPAASPLRWRLVEASPTNP